MNSLTIIRTRGENRQILSFSLSVATESAVKLDFFFFKWAYFYQYLLNRLSKKERSVHTHLFVNSICLIFFQERPNQREQKLTISHQWYTMELVKL